MLVNEGGTLDLSNAERRDNLDDLSVVLDRRKPGTLYTIAVFSTVQGREGDKAVLTASTASAAPAAPVTYQDQIQDNRATFDVKVGEVAVPAGVNKELLSIKYYKLENGQAVPGTEVYYMQRLQVVQSISLPYLYSVVIVQLVS